MVQVPPWGAGRMSIDWCSPAERWRMAARYPATRPRARALRLALRAMAAIGVGRTTVGLSQGLPSRALLKECAEPWLSVVSIIGTPSPSQKVVSFVEGPGRGFVVVKTGFTPGSRARLAHEAEMLRVASPAIAPSVLEYQELPEASVLITEGVSGRPMRGTDVPPDGLLRTLSDGRTVTYAGHEHPWIANLRASETEAAAVAIGALSHRRWPTVLMHGDLAPWNVVVNEGGSYRVVDWEYGSAEGFPWVDRAFWSLQTSRLIERHSPDASVRIAADTLVREAGLTLSEALAVLLLACLHVETTRAADGRAVRDEEVDWYAACAGSACARCEAVDGARS